MQTKYFLALLSCLLLGVFIYSCQDDIFEEQYEPTEQAMDYKLENRSQDSIFLLATHSSSSGYDYELSNDDAETLFKHMADAFGLDSSLVTYDGIELDDNQDSTNAAPFVVLLGENPSGASLSFGIDVVKSANLNGGVDYEYDATQDVEGLDLFKKHKCEGDPCNSCKVVRNGFLNTRFKKCDCLQIGIGKTCNHTVETMSLLDILSNLPSLP